jgi:enterochelin esterase-like enzyme
VDAGFLELVRLGIKSPDDPLIVKSVKVVDEVLRVKTPNGESFYRYNNDGYGEMDDGRRWNWDGKYTGKGRLWALLAGERGQYELAKVFFDFERFNRIGGKPSPSLIAETEKIRLKAKSRLDAMLYFANEGLMIPEQIWDKADVPKNIDRQFIPELKFGEGTGSATPLAWSMAQFIRLAVNLQAGKNLDTPDVVYNRYVLGKKTEKTTTDITKISELTRSGRSGKEVERNIQNPLLAMCGTVGDCKKNASEMFACFAYKGEFKTIEIAGDFTNWKPKPLPKIEKAEGGKVSDGNSFDCLIFAKSARVEYKLIVDGKWITDPLNPNKVDNGVGGENSFFTMPDYQPTEWNNAVGQTKYGISIEKINSKIYGEREVQIYVPESLSTQNLPVMYLQDGTDYQKRAEAVFIQRNLVKADKIKPFIMVFLDPKDRMKEYWANDNYAKYVATEVVPAIDAKYKTVKSRDGRAILGASLGGVTSVHAGVKYPEIFGRVGGQSSSFWIDKERVIKELETLDAGKNKFVFYFDVGILEGAEDDRKAVEILRRKGFDVTYQERETGHNWTSWRDRLADAFVALWK